MDSHPHDFKGTEEMDYVALLEWNEEEGKFMPSGTNKL